MGDRTHPAAPQLHHPARLEPLERVAHHRREHRSGTARGHALATRDGPRIPRPLSGDVRSLQDPRDDPAGQIRPRCGRPRSRGGLPRHLRKRGLPRRRPLDARRHGARRGACARHRLHDARGGQLGRRQVDARRRTRTRTGAAHGKHLGEPPQRTAYDHLLGHVPPHGRRVPDRHPRHQGIRPDRHRRSRTVALLPRNDAHRGGLPLLQLHPHPRTGLCRARGGRTGRARSQRRSPSGRAT